MTDDDGCPPEVGANAPEVPSSRLHRAQKSQARVQCQARVQAVPHYRWCDFGQVGSPHCCCFKCLRIPAFYAKRCSPLPEAGALRVTLKHTGRGRGPRAWRSTETTVADLSWRRRGALREPGRPSTVAGKSQCGPWWPVGFPSSPRDVL